MSALLLLGLGYLAVLFVALITGAAAANDGHVMRSKAPEGYWLMVACDGLAGLSAFLVAAVA